VTKGMDWENVLGFKHIVIQVWDNAREKIVKL
jgi:hypothetical protein